MTNKLTSIDTEDAIKMAIQCTIDMQDYYEASCSLIQNDDAIAILKGLAEKHEQTKSKLIKAYSKVSGKKILYLRLHKKHRLMSLLPCPDEINDAVDIAKKNENEIKSFYVTVSRRVYQNDIRTLFRQLALDCEQRIALLESSFIETLNLEDEEVKADQNEMREIASTN